MNSRFNPNGLTHYITPTLIPTITRLYPIPGRYHFSNAIRPGLLRICRKRVDGSIINFGAKPPDVATARPSKCSLRPRPLLLFFTHAILFFRPESLTLFHAVLLSACPGGPPFKVGFPLTNPQLRIRDHLSNHVGVAQKLIWRRGRDSNPG